MLSRRSKSILAFLTNFKYSSSDASPASFAAFNVANLSLYTVLIVLKEVKKNPFLPLIFRGEVIKKAVNAETAVYFFNLLFLL